MLTYARWKYVVLILAILFSTLYALPNLYQKDPSVQVTASRGAPIDQALADRVADTLKQANIPTKQVEIAGDNLLVRLTGTDFQSKAADALAPVLGNDYVTALNLASTVPAWLDKLGAHGMLLGLDLQGGVHFLMQVDQKAALDKHLDAIVEDARVVLRDGRVRYESVTRRPDNSIVVRLVDAADAANARKLIAASQPALRMDVDGQALTMHVPDVELQRMMTDALNQNLGTLRNRINALGVAEPLIQRQGTDRIVVELPGVQDTAQAKRIIGATATLEYRAVVEGNAYDAVASGSVPPQAKIYYRKELGPDGKPVPILLNKRVIASGDQLIGATSGLDPQSGTPSVSVRLDSAGGQRMFDFTSGNVGKPMAVVYIERVPQVRVVDGKEIRSTRVSEEVISVANINGVFGKEFQTTGLDSSKEAADLALLLRSGSLAAPMDFVEERIVGPSLGRENIERGLTAVTYSFTFALLFFLVYYRMFGLITCLALLLNILMLVAVMSLFGATLTLPGLAGIALTVGLSVDANVLINERIREELRAGIPPKSAIVTGYEKATGTITDANLTAILAGVALFAFGTGPVKGFAVALIVGIATSMYTAVSGSRAIATLIYGKRKNLKSLAI
ncbi:preprotein translocase subunit SecD [Lysobacter concretionis Ko07 = DSM 16239]|uniref:Protein translocase subunit SecD n=1 Tax=Lysobacter concretionis Ko07 = DSM 16239 TaxID=1122185 RepID=A0A0A0EKR2_9GAMM|nr:MULTISPECIES: protein translocase subunit SecD [Lysobacter]KGM50944.1 preprotein translocase subunit SecD [Lysobacter concretionis Ko07 = DSM 16239]QOD90368.1 protein translocase subunit SecD [Lysobacter sp. CW239]